ncbi:hypothetical protein QP027_00505 [Corynebacterium breve]|uniref:Uncharacterized protein n=1 Tax=Corynebacterium breve TaxID=3049799 RepID=A0ABY8VF03_9CORY|nr:hypothetical protein [Corynebacterium breve]WIM67917.1 hypothetical protein QP027_00505 [Corynebacterium breve]
MAANKKRASLAVSALCFASVAAAPAVNAADWEDTTIKPGETITLTPTDSTGSSRVEIAERSTIPAGWSVRSTNGKFQVSAPMNATSDQVATLVLVDATTPVDEVKISVSAPTTAATPTATKSSDGNWLESLVSQINSFFKS